VTTPEQSEPEVTAPDQSASEAAESEAAESEAAASEAAESEAAESEGAAPAAMAADSVRAAERRRRLAEVFGDVLPESTRDDRVEGGSPTGADDRWYTENRPPHHGG
jgi:hypothetical protein